MRKRAIVAFVVGGILLVVESKSVEADPDGGLEAFAQELGRILNRRNAEEAGDIAGRMELVAKAIEDGSTTPQAAREDVLAEILETQGPYADLLYGGEVSWRNRIAEVRATDAALAAEETAAGQQPPTASDSLHAFQLGATVKFRASIGKALEPVKKALTAAGRPVSIVGRFVPDPQHPSGYVEAFVPFFLPLLCVWGDCDGTASVLALDPGIGQEPAAAESYLQVVSPGVQLPVAELRMTSAEDFAGETPVLFEFAGLAPGNYVLRAGVIKDGVHGLVDDVTFTIPAWDPANPPPQPSRTAAAQAKKLGIALRRFVKQEGSALVKEVKAIAKDAARGELTQDEAWDQFVELMRRTHGRLADLKSEHRDGWRASIDSLPAAEAARELECGTGSSGDRVQLDDELADDLGRSYFGKAAATFGKYGLKVGAPFAYAQSTTWDVPHPAVGPPPTSSRSTSFFGGMTLLATCTGRFAMYVVDPRDGDEIDRVFIEVRESDTRTLILRRELTDDDVDEDWIGLIEEEGLLRSGRTYDVRAVTAGDPPFATLDAATITAPSWGTSLSCDTTAAAVTLKGKPVTIPPLHSFDAGFVGNGLQSVNLVFRDASKPMEPIVSFGLLTSTPIQLDTAAGDEWISPFPPREAGLSAYVYDPSTFYFTSAQSGTFTLRNLKNLLQPPGCAEVTVDGVTADGDPVRFQFTLHTDQLGQ